MRNIPKILRHFSNMTENKIYINSLSSAPMLLWSLWCLSLFLASLSDPSLTSWTYSSSVVASEASVVALQVLVGVVLSHFSAPSWCIAKSCCTCIPIILIILSKENSCPEKISLQTCSFCTFEKLPGEGIGFWRFGGWWMDRIVIVCPWLSTWRIIGVDFSKKYPQMQVC